MVMSGNKTESSQLAGKVALITGSSMGIGKTLAAELCKAGAIVMLNGRNSDRLAAAESELLKRGFRVGACAADITIYAECEKLISETIRRFGNLDILVNNAGIVGYGPFEKFDPDQFRKALDSNIYGAVYPTMASIPHIRRSSGSIVFISSLAGLMGLPDYTTYSAGKMALTALWQSLRAEFEGTGVHFGIVYVGFTRNEEGKRFLSTDGSSVPVPQRKKSLQWPREKVAHAIMNLIRKRRPRVILSPFGKLTAVTIRFLPFIARKIVARNR